jgi:sugar lactone lactonase YvrE
MWGLGQIWKFDTNYRHSSMIDVQNKFVTNMAFGGENLDRLFVTYAQDDSIGKFGGICEVVINKNLLDDNHMSSK